MIKTTLVAMTLLGCDCDAKVCQFISQTEPQWETVASCQAAMKQQVQARDDLQFPLITAECQSAAADEPAIAAAQPITPTSVDEPTILQRLTDGTATAFRRTSWGYDLVATGASRLADTAAAIVRPTVTMAAGWLGQ